MQPHHVLLRIGVFHLVAAALFCSHAAAQPAIGLYGGLNRSSLSGDVPTGLSYTPRIGFMGGLIAEFDVATDVRLSLQPMFLERGTSIAKEYDEAPEAIFRDSLRASLSYVSLPLLVKISAASGRTFVSSGLEVAFLANAVLARAEDGGEERDISSSLQNLDVALHLGFGIVFPLGTPLLTLEARYSQSLLNLSNMSVETGRGALPLRFRSSSITILAALLLPLGGGE